MLFLLEQFHLALQGALSNWTQASNLYLILPQADAPHFVAIDRSTSEAVISFYKGPKILTDEDQMFEILSPDAFRAEIAGRWAEAEASWETVSPTIMLQRVSYITEPESKDAVTKFDNLIIYDPADQSKRAVFYTGEPDFLLSEILQLRTEFAKPGATHFGSIERSVIETVIALPPLAKDTIGLMDTARGPIFDWNAASQFPASVMYFLSVFQITYLPVRFLRLILANFVSDRAMLTRFIQTGRFYDGFMIIADRGGGLEYYIRAVSPGKVESEINALASNGGSPQS